MKDKLQCRMSGRIHWIVLVAVAVLAFAMVSAESQDADAETDTVTVTDGTPDHQYPDSKYKTVVVVRFPGDHLEEYSKYTYVTTDAGNVETGYNRLGGYAYGSDGYLKIFVERDNTLKMTSDDGIFFPFGDNNESFGLSVGIGAFSMGYKLTEWWYSNDGEKLKPIEGDLFTPGYGVCEIVPIFEKLDFSISYTDQFTDDTMVVGKDGTQLKPGVDYTLPTTYDITDDLVLFDLARPGYEFVGWTADFTGTHDIRFPTKQLHLVDEHVGNVILNPVWEPLPASDKPTVAMQAPQPQSDGVSAGIALAVALAIGALAAAVVIRRR